MNMVLVIILGVYVVLLLVLLIGWLSIQISEPEDAEPQLFYSIIVPVRNESKRLLHLLQSFNGLEFPVDRFEVIFVNDHSEDHSISVLENYQCTFDYKVFHMINEEGKKAALNVGIKQARGAVILTTDADCIVPSQWLSQYAVFFEKKKAMMVSAPVTFYNERSLFDRIQTVEFSSLIGTGAATLALGFPSMCNGANLAFLKSAFYEVNGYSENMKVPSGDDEFLMHKIARKHPDNVFFAKAKQATVRTEPVDTLVKFYHQRKRWASKWKTYASFKNTLMATTVFIIQVAVLAAIISLVVAPTWDVAVLLLIKMAIEGLFIATVLRRMGKKMKLVPFFILQIVYPLYAIFFGLSANFGRYSWKGRKHEL